MRLNSQFENRFFENRRSKINDKIQKATRNASSGVKVQSAADDPAGLAISETTRAQIRGLAQSQRNIQDSIALMKTAEDGLTKTNEDVQRLYEVSIMASNDTMDDQSRSELQMEVNELLSSIQQTSETVQFNTRNLLGPVNNPNNQKSISILIGSGPSESITIDLMDSSTQSLGLSNASVIPRENAVQLLKTTQNVMNKISEHVTKLGSQYSALEKNLDNSSTLQNNLTTIEANIRDSNIGKEIMDLTINKVLSESINNLHKFTDDQKKNFEKILFG